MHQYYFLRILFHIKDFLLYRRKCALSKNGNLEPDQNNQFKLKIKPLQPPWKNVLLNYIKRASQEIFIITPKLKLDIVKMISNLLLSESPSGPYKFKILFHVFLKTIYI